MTFPGEVFPDVLVRHRYRHVARMSGGYAHPTVILGLHKTTTMPVVQKLVIFVFVARPDSMALYTTVYALDM